MRFGSVCSGIEAASVAWNPLGLEAAWVAEIEPFPCAVLAHHYPNVLNLGDMTTLVGRIIAGDIEAPDMLAGGTPCQAFSVAGLRKSLDDYRGNLTLTFCEIADAIDTARDVSGREPCIVFWENVPGVLNTSDNAFGCFLGKLAGEDCPLVPAGEGWPNAGCVIGPKRTIAWRVLDAQYFGLAQRRKRVFVVASARDGVDPVEILFVEEGMRRDSPPSREAGQVAPTIPSRSTAGGGLGTDFDCDGGLIPEIALCLNAGGMGRIDAESETMIVAHSLRGEGFDASEDGTGRGTPLVPVHCFGFAQNQRDEVRLMDVAGALAAEAGMKQQTYVAFSCKDHGADASDIAPTLRSMGHDGSHANGGGQVAVAFAIQERAVSENPNNGPQGKGYQEGVAYTMEARHHVQAVACSMQVRRLTPRECERLQGFPDDYTRIPYRNKSADECPDGPRYKALGNSWAVPVVRWIGRRIMASLTLKQERRGK